MSIPICITTDFTDDGGLLEPKLALFAEAGFTHIHWCEHWSRDFLYEDFYTDGVRRLLTKHGLAFLDTHNAETLAASPSAEDENARKHGVRLLENRIRFTAALDGDAVVVHPPGKSATPEQNRLRWENLERSFGEASKLCEETGVRIALENLTYGVAEDFHALLSKLNTRWLGFCYDSGHANVSKQPELIERYGPRLAALHLHDNQGEKDEHALPGRGTVDWPRIMKALKNARYPKVVNFELMLRDQGSERDFVQDAFVKCSGVLALGS